MSNLYLPDRLNSTTTLMNRDENGAGGNFSRNGQWIIFGNAGTLLRVRNPAL